MRLDATVLGHADDPQLAILDKGDDRRQRRIGHRDMPADHVGHRRCGAHERNVHDFDAGLPVQRFARDVMPRSMPGAAVAEFAGLLLRFGNEVADRLDRRRRRNHQRHIGLGHPADADHVLGRVEWEILVGERVHHHRGIDAEQQRVAVGRRAQGGGRTVVASAARPVFDHHRLAKRFGEFRLQDARHGIDAGAGRPRRDDGHRARWKIVGGGRKHDGREGAGGRENGTHKA
jgi:hypothetical protein